MHLVKVNRTFPRLRSIPVRQFSHPALEQNEYTEAPEYPPIEDLSLAARKQRARQAVHAKLQKLNTVEEKQIGLNMPRYYGFKSIVLREDKVPFNALPLVQHYTRTHFKNIEKLPEAYVETEPAAELVVKEIKSLVEDAITIENEGIEHSFTSTLDKGEKQQKEDALSRCVARQVNRIITNNLAEKLPHILSAQVDYDPRHEAFWFVGGVLPPKSVVRWRFRYPWLRSRANESVDRPVQYLGSPLIALRSNLPLKPIIPYSEADNPEFAIPKFDYHPETVGYYPDYRHGTNIPGFWPGDRDEHGLLSIHGRGHILERKSSFGPQDNLEALHCQAIKASFGWLLSQANFLGFTTYNDITYPLATQTVLTNGQLWSLYAYQLNTIEIHGDATAEKSKQNICFGTQPLKLYDKIEEGRVKGLNEEVLKMLVQFYLNAPEEREHEMKPYLGKEEQVVADIEDDKKREWLENRYKHLMSNRPKHNLVPEVYHWELIYKIKYQTRNQEPKRRPFEKHTNPFQRKLNEHLPPYIPKVLRPYPKARKRFETTYYPDV